MDVFLTHTTAQRFYETCHEAGRPSLVLPGVDCARTPQEARALGFDVPDEADLSFEPLEVMIDTQSHRTCFPQVACHALPAGVSGELMRNFGRGIYVVSPALSLVQFASTHTVPETIKYGSALCGPFRLTGEHGEGTEDRPALASVAELARDISSWHNLAGLKTCKKALPWINENCASPAEIHMNMRFDLPYRYGGYGISKPHANFKIELSKSEQRASGLSCCYGDAVWPEHNLVVEYDSGKYHSSAVKLERDAMRRNTLRHAGYTVLEVTNQQLTSIDAFEQIVEEVARITGKRIAPDQRGKTPARLELMRTLFPWNVYR